MSSQTSRYVRYKNATEEFVSWLRSKVPDVSKSVKMTANRGHQETAIELREEVMKKYKSDEGHSYFFDMLKDVKARLFPLLKSDEGKGKRKKTKETEKDEALVNHFSPLSVDEAIFKSSETEEDAADQEEPDVDPEQGRLEWKKKEMIVERDTCES
ncbi:hypothetical protein HDU96_001021 [Phlyctochytrium bullatum]|nr:hypothetical protein HDU96_001021 [Phlyctochytrium bullatum]